MPFICFGIPNLARKFVDRSVCSPSLTNHMANATESPDGTRPSRARASARGKRRTVLSGYEGCSTMLDACRPGSAGGGCPDAGHVPASDRPRASDRRLLPGSKRFDRWGLGGLHVPSPEGFRWGRG